MDRVVDYHHIVEDVIRGYDHKPSHGDIETEVIVDHEQGHYELMQVGWDRRHRVHGSVIHIDIIDGKIWIQYDGTSPGVALDLVAAGVPREDIVLAFKPEHVRPYTDYAVG
jgi:hypothetical protein